MVVPILTTAVIEAHDEGARLRVPSDCHRGALSLVVRPCLDCQRPTRNGSRCPSCSQQRAARRDRQRGTRSQRGYTNDWWRTVQRAIAEQPYCTLCGATTDLTGDHIVPLSRGGSNHPSNVRVLCRSCNSARGNRT